MYKQVNVIEVTCPTNPDYCGKFERDEIEEEMRELHGVTNDWISYVLDHLFDDEPEFTSKLDDAICNLNITSVTVRFGDDYVTIKKI